MLLSKRLKALRVERSIMQKDIANAIGVSVQAYSNYEVGKREPDLDTVIRLAEYFGVTADYLLGLVSAPNLEVPPPTELIEITAALIKLNEKGELDGFRDLLLNLLSLDEGQRYTILYVLNGLLGKPMQVGKMIPLRPKQTFPEVEMSDFDKVEKAFENSHEDVKSDLARMSRQKKRLSKNRRGGKRIRKADI